MISNDFQMRTHWARKGRPATLNCTLKAPTDNTNFSLEWRRDGQLVHSAYGTEPGHSSPDLQGEISLNIRVFESQV